MLFNHFTWQQFLVAALILSSIWYVVVIPLLYREKLKAFFDRNKAHKPVEPLGHEWDEELADELEQTDELMGKPVLPEGMSKVSMSMFGFAPTLEELDERRQRQQGLVPDVIEELKSIFHILEKEQGSKADFIALFGLVKVKYGAIRGTPDERALNEYIRENVLFPISDEELTNLWR
ncbi:MAG TPA: hypothetical protein VIM89_15780 [Mucilaginibacter sp.]